MGTNYYARIIPTKKRKEELKDIIDSGNFDKIKEEINKSYGGIYLDFEDKSIQGGIVHLGKRSAGWKFLWDPNMFIVRNGHSEKIEIEPGHCKYTWIPEPDTYKFVYPLTKKGIKEFIDREDVKIFDEYDKEEDKEEFFQMALDWITWNGEEAWDGKSYYEWEKSKGNNPWHPSGTDGYIKGFRKSGFNIEFPYTDFYSDGLRFSTGTDFS